MSGCNGLKRRIKATPYGNNSSITFTKLFLSLPSMLTLYDFDWKRTLKGAVKPTGKKLNGDPEYTLPVIVDDSTGITLSDYALQAAFRDAVYPKLNAFYPFVIPTVPLITNPASAVFFRTKYETMFGKT
ncbi:hypothetical protein BT96DRAFT_1023936 [Gymnopus androsaceus JB14]|uniref:Glutathione S-transferase UstS-like C-terminal domain-containing protein n=1 Tax=Gymnopus androsaceus JB14 TaxID=1447944 RepID=A0A6A4H325_9AGAR|nr:hypothetical protein BT96DRAFT_1023936 [Gymnopus androsaceus JB14]